MNNSAPSAQGNGGLIRVTDLCKSYDNGLELIHVLRDINLKVNPGEIVAIMGPSGSGKSTLLFILGIFLLPSSGSYFLGGQDVLSLDRTAQAEFRRRRVGFVFQSCDLLENSTVYENLEFPLIYAGVERRDRPERITVALEQVNLGHRMHHSSNRLSGGERQRVAVARALVNQPQVILADEPTGQLDRSHGHLIMDHFGEIVSDGKTAIIVVTHDPEIATRCTRICSIRDGVLYEQ
ncbi:MAG: ABC transporter ATP-binding protein [Deltaproteobacteria bacterium]|jgi:putative ABC transport system ATP-binding protein